MTTGRINQISTRSFTTEPPVSESASFIQHTRFIYVYIHIYIYSFENKYICIIFRARTGSPFAGPASTGPSGIVTSLPKTDLAILRTLSPPGHVAGNRTASQPGGHYVAIINTVAGDLEPCTAQTQRLSHTYSAGAQAQT